MNHIYKVVWSTVTNSLVVVSELARSKGKAASTVSDVKDLSNKTAAVAVAAALQVAAASTIVIGSFAPMEANAIVAISSAENGTVQSDTAKANTSMVIGGRYPSSIDDGTRAYNYYNPGSLSYENATSKESAESGSLYDSNKYVHGIAIGCHTDAIATTGKGGSNGIAIGDYSRSTGGLSVALGALSQATDVGAMALGTSSRASGFNSLAMMRQSAATGDYSVAIGSVSYAKGNSSFAMGSSATAFGNQSIAIGSVSPTTYDATNGYEARRTSYDAVNRTQTNGDRSMALGSGAKTSGDDSFAVGSNATTGTFTTSNNETTPSSQAKKAIAFGNNATAVKDKAVAFGNNASAKGEESVAFAFNATAVGNQSVAFGTNATAGHDRVVTIGTNSTATHNRSMAIGEDAKAKANHSLAIGANSSVTVENSVSLGSDSYADEIGGQANMTINGHKYEFAGKQAKGTVSIGSGYDNDQERAGTVVRTITDLGAGRVLANSTDAINGSQLYAVVTEINKGWNVTTGNVDGGEVSGTSNANVINGETVKFIAGKNVKLTQQDQNLTIATKDDVTFTNVKSDKVNATTVNASDLAVTGGTTVNNFTVKPGATIDMGGNRVTNVGTPTADNDATTKKYVDNGRTQVTSNDGSVTITNSTTNDGAKVYDLKVNANVSYAGDTGNGTNKLSDPIKFAGTTDEIVTTAKNGEVAFKLADKVKESLKKADSAMQEFTVGADVNHQADGIKVNQTTKRFDIIGTEGYVNTTVTGTSVQVDIAQKFKDTVSNNTQNIANNTKKIEGNTQNITNNANNIANNTQNITNNTNTIAKGFGLQAEDNKVVNKKLGENVSVVGGNSNINTTVKDGKIAINLNNTLNLTNSGSVKMGDTTINNDGLTITGGPSVTKEGINAGDKKITNVTAGDVNANSKDAVNGSQLYATNQNVTNNTNSINSLNTTVQAGWELQVGGVKAKNVTPTSNVANFVAGDNINVSIADNKSVVIATKKNVTFDNVTANNGLTVNKGATINMGDNVVKGVANGTLSADSKDAVNGSQLYATNQNVTNLETRVNGGFGLKAEDGNNVTKQLGDKIEVIGGNKNINTTVDNGKVKVNLNNTLDLSDKGSVTTGNTTVNNGGVTIKAAPGKTEVSLTNNGLNNGGNTITNVSEGVAGTDAVNVNQLNKVNATANAGWSLQANHANGSTVKPNATVSLNNTDGNIVISKTANDNNVTFGLNNTVKVGTGDKAVTIDGTNGTIGGLTNKTFDPNNIVSGQAATEDQLQSSHNTLKNNITNLGNELTTKGLNFVGDNKGEVVHRDLGATLSVVGGADQANLSDNNIGVVGNKDGSLLTVKLAKTLKDLTNATFTNGAGNNGNTVINGSGVTITPSTGDTAKTVSLTNNGLNNGGNTITNVAAGVNQTDAVNVSQLEKVNATAKAGWNLEVNNNSTDATKVTPNATVSLNNKDGNIVITKENGNVTFALNNDLTIGGKDGVNGTNGKDGQIGVKGADGQSGVTLNGKDGSIGLTGPAGADGKPGASANITVANDKPGLDGQPGETKTRIVYNTTTSDGKTVREEVATLNDGLKFVGDKGKVIAKKLNETLAIKGNLTESANVTDKNLRVDNEGDELIIKMAKELKDLTNATFTSTNSNTTIGGNGVTITPNGGDATKTVSLTDKGLNNGNNTITNVARGVNGTDAVNVDQLKEVSSVANAGWNLTVNGTSSSNVAPNATVDLANKDGNIVITKDKNNVTFALNSNLTVGGKDGKDGSIGVNGKDGSAVVLNGKDGSIGLTGPRGADGKSATATITVEKGPVGVDGKDGANGTDGMTRIVYTDPNGTKHNVSTLNDGLSFVGNTGGAVAKKLNETLTIKGALANESNATAENIRVDNVSGNLIVKLAQNLTNLTTATFGNDTNDQLVINKDGVTIKGADATKTVSVTDKGLNNGNNTITNVSSGLVDNNGTKVALKDANGTTLTNAVNVGDLKDTVKELTNATTGGFGLKDSAGNEVKQDLGTSIKVTGKDGVNATVVTDGNGKALQIGLNSTVTIGDNEKPGTITVKGENGKDGVAINGKDGSIGLTGAPGKDGKDAKATITVAQGKPGVDGKDGETKTRIVYNTTTPDGKPVTEEVATLNDGLNFIGNQGEKVAKKLNETLTIKGTLANDAAANSENVRVDSQNGELVVKLAQNLANLTTATFGNTATDKTVVGKDGVTISTDKPENTVSLTDKGLNNGNNQITNVTSGLTDATGKTTDLANATSTNAVNVGDLKETVKNITTDGFGLKDDNGTEVKQDLGKTIQIKGKDGVTVTSNVTDKSLEVALAGDVVVNGKDGKDGTIGVKGADGKNGTTITKDAIVFNGIDGVNGKDGKDGADGQASIKVEKGAKGIDGNDGKDGESKTRIVYEKPNGDKEEVATLNDGLHFVGDKGTSIAKKLNDTLAIKGNLTSTAEVTDKNLRVDNEGGELIIKMAKVLTDLTSANFTDAAGNNTIIGGNGVTITPKAGDTVSLTDKGLNNGNNTITNVKAGLNGTDAVNVDQLEKVNATANAGWKLTNNGTNESTVTPNATVDLANKDGNIIITKDGNNVTFGFNSNLTVGGPGKDGKDGKDGSIGVKGADGTTGVTLNGKDGSIGLTGAPGKDGKNASANITVAQGAKGLDGNDGANGESKTRIVYEKPNGEKEEVATLNDGLNFVGNDGKVVAKKLNDTLAIKGGINTEAGLNAASDRNVGVRENDKGLNIVIAERPTFSGITVDGKDGKDAEVKFAKDGKDGMSIVGTRGADGKDGLTIRGADGKDGVSFKDDGRITNVADGKDGKDAVNKDQLERVNATANAGWKLTANGSNLTTVTPNATVDLANKDGNIVITKEGNNVTFDLTNKVTVGNDKEPGVITVKGENGKDGVSINGKDGISIKGENGQDAVSINGKDGNGAIAVNGKDGKTGVGLDGANGTIGINGKDGSNGTITVEKGPVGVDGTDGANGKDGMTRIVYTDANGTKHNVSTLNDGLSFVGDTGNPIAKKLNQTLTIKGNLDAAADVTDKNLRVDNVDGALIIKMAKSLTDLTNATFTSANSNTTIGGNGVTITPNTGNTVSLTDKGLNNGNNQITNVSSGLVERDGKTKVDLVNATGDVLNNAVNVGDLKDSVNNLTNATTGGFGLTDENGKDVKADLGKTVTVLGDGSVKTEVVEKDGKKALQIGLTSNVTVGNDKEPGVITVKGENGKDSVSINGKDGISIKGENGQDAVSINGKDGNGAIAVNGKDGKTGVGLDGANGTIGINGKDGSNGTITVAQGAKSIAGNDGKDGESKTRIVYEKPNGEKEEVATLNDGLTFVGNDGKVINKKLNETLAIKGNLSTSADTTANNLRVDNVNGDLIIKMAKSLKDLTDATFTSANSNTTIGGNGVTITPNTGNTVSLTDKGLDNGGNKVVNVAAGDVSATSTDAVNGSQLYAVSEVANKGWNIQTNGNASTNVKPGDTVNFANGNNIEINNDGTNVTVGLAKDVDLGKDGSIKAGDTVMNNDGVKVGDKVSLTKDGLTAGNVTISAETGISAGNKQITNVSSGLGGIELKDAKGDTLTNAANIGDLQTAISGVTDATKGGGFGLADDNGTEVKQSLGQTIQVKGDGNVKTNVTNGSLTVSLNKDVDLGKDGSLTAGGTKVSENGVSFADSLVNLTSNGLNNGGNKVTNVKAGEVSATSTDAVNGSQLYATNQNVTNVQNTVAKGWNIEAGTVEGSTGKVTGASKSNVAMGDTVGVKAGNNIEITQDGANIAIATSATPTFETVTVGKDGNTATVSTVQDQYGSAIKVAGADGKSETRINNVADGKADNDAVNVRQLKGVAQNVANIDNRVSKLDKRVRGIGANSAAASSLPQVMLPGKSMVAVAGGAYSGASAVAVGYSRASDNGKLILKVNGTANSAGHYSGGVGVGYQW
ncbi:YadA-like family protein [Actinobacillus vicugnae]|uniref:YadA-like family protein n=1 Tax=Actinobacillus vicugnae TaxID=2573093 RepID=UPI0012404BCD|nr:YadA-like family protein [Actinobacillus vicugnae]